MAKATLTSAMTDDLHKGVASISLLPYVADGIDFNSLDFTSADQIFTLKDSFSLTPSDPTTEEIKIDQGDKSIDTTVEKGEYKMAGQIPTVATAVLDYFMEKKADVTTLKGQKGETYKGSAYGLDTREVTCSVLIESASGKTAIAFAKVKFVVPGVALENGSTPAYVGFNADVLANGAADNGDFAVLKAAE